MRVRRLQRDWERLARVDAMSAILCPGRLRVGAWDEREDEFFASGEAEIAAVMETVGRLAPDLARESALDFGCGIGRLTRPLAARFREAVGVDVAPTMIARARARLPAGVACRFVCNEAPGLQCFDDGTFDFVYSRLTLQHIPPALSRGYVEAFLRVLRPGGLAAFQVPSRQLLAGGWPRRSLPAGARRAWREIKARSSLEAKMRSFCVPRADIETTVAGAGGHVLQISPDDSLPGFESFMYYVTTPC